MKEWFGPLNANSACDILNMPISGLLNIARWIAITMAIVCGSIALIGIIARSIKS